VKLHKGKTRILRLGVDVRDLRLAATGTKTYLEEFLREASKRHDAVQLIRLDSIWNPYCGKAKWGKALEHVLFFFWKQFTLPLKTYSRGVDVLFCSDYYVPLLKIKARHMVVFHDAVFFDHPEYYHPLWLKLFRWIAMPAARKADAIIVPTTFSASRLLQVEPRFAGKIHVVHQGPKSFAAEAALTPASASVFRQLQGLPYFLHVGVIEKRKNLPALVKAMAMVCITHDVRLVLVGRSSGKIYNDGLAELMQVIREEGLEDKVLLTGYLPDTDLPFWYRHALAYIFPSRYEGFGIPILEAFHFGIPVGVADNSCLKEIGGEAVMEFSPDSITGIAAVMQELITNEPMRHSMIEKGRQRFQEFTWSSAADRIIRIAENIARS
jgi:glycosyltransferase involved in cell wall biosynthesis